MKTARIYYHRRHVAVCLADTNETVYLTADEAEALACTLQESADAINRHREFADTTMLLESAP